MTLASTCGVQHHTAQQFHSCCSTASHLCEHTVQLSPSAKHHAMRSLVVVETSAAGSLHRTGKAQNADIKLLNTLHALSHPGRPPLFKTMEDDYLARQAAEEAAKRSAYKEEVAAAKLATVSQLVSGQVVVKPPSWAGSGSISPGRSRSPGEFIWCRRCCL